MKATIANRKRLYLGLTQADMARVMGIHYHLWVKWERNEQRITAAPLRQIEILTMLKDQHPAIFQKIVRKYTGTNPE